MRLTVIASGSKGNAYVLEHSGGLLLLDAGLPYRQIVEALGDAYSQLRAVLVTHEHKDHSKSAAEFARRGVPVLMSKGTADAIGVAQYRMMIDGGWHQLPGATVQAFAAQHDAAEPLGFVVYDRATMERLAYVTDTYYLRYRLPRINYWVIECNYCDDLVDNDSPVDKRRLQSHMGLARLKDLFAGNDLTMAHNIVLVHLSDAKADEWQMVQEITHATGVNTIAAIAGAVIPLGGCNAIIK